MKTAQYGIANIVNSKQFGDKLIVEWRAPLNMCSGTLELFAITPMRLQSKNKESKLFILPSEYRKQSVFLLK